MCLLFYETNSSKTIIFCFFCSHILRSKLQKILTHFRKSSHLFSRRPVSLSSAQTTQVQEVIVFHIWCTIQVVLPSQFYLLINDYIKSRSVCSTSSRLIWITCGGSGKRWRSSAGDLNIWNTLYEINTITVVMAWSVVCCMCEVNVIHTWNDWRDLFLQTIMWRGSSWYLCDIHSRHAHN